MRKLLEACAHCAEIRDETKGRRLRTFLALQMQPLWFLLILPGCEEKSSGLCAHRLLRGIEGKYPAVWAKAVPLSEDLESLKLNRLTIH